jgi:tRNA uridine 5-carboxymethylaminomethyl modification enzyme
VGLVSDERYHIYLEKVRQLEKGKAWLQKTKITPSSQVQEYLAAKGSAPLKGGVSLDEFLRRPEISFSDLIVLAGDQELSSEVTELLEIENKYAGYLQRQESHVARMEKLENKRLPENIDYNQMRGLSREAQEKLIQVRPSTLGQASRIPGVTPADISVLWVALEHRKA